MDKATITLSIEEYDELLKKQKQLEESQQIITALSDEVNELRWENEDLKRRLWGKSSEKRKLPEDPQELDICYSSPVDVRDPIAEEAQALEQAKKEEVSYNRFRKTFTKKITPHARTPIDATLPREEIIVPMPAKIDLKGAVLIGKEVTEQIAIRPVQLYVIRIIRDKYRLADGSIVIAPMPVMAHPRSNASESVLAHIAIAKYADHLPIHRQLEAFERAGIKMSPSTVSNWMMAAAQRLEPIYNEMRELVKKSHYVMADETPHPVLENDRPGALHRGYMWNFYLPDRKTPFFEYHQGRGKEGIATLLAGQVEVVQSDGFSVYNQFDSLPNRLHLCCWAHVRRKFSEAESNDPIRAKYALDQIGKLYQVEREIKEKNLTQKEDILNLRRTQAYPVIIELEKWCKRELTETIIDSPIAKAISYMYKRFEQLSGYVNDARFQIDNNPIERSIRPLTLNRKNTLFSGSHEAAHTAAIFFTLLGCCKENGVNPQKWMEEALIKVQNPELEKANDYSSLIPFNSKN